MADRSTVNEGTSCHQKGIEFIGNISSAMRPVSITPVEPDLAMVTQLEPCRLSCYCRGRYNTPALAANAIEHGASAVTVGSGYHPYWLHSSVVQSRSKDAEQEKKKMNKHY